MSVACSTVAYDTVCGSEAEVVGWDLSGPSAHASGFPMSSVHAVHVAHRSQLRTSMRRICDYIQPARLGNPGRRLYATLPAADLFGNRALPSREPGPTSTSAFPTPSFLAHGPIRTCSLPRTRSRSYPYVVALFLCGYLSRICAVAPSSSFRIPTQSRNARHGARYLLYRTPAIAFTPLPRRKKRHKIPTYAHLPQMSLSVMIHPLPPSTPWRSPHPSPIGHASHHNHNHNPQPHNHTLVLQFVFVFVLHRLSVLASLANIHPYRPML